MKKKLGETLLESGIITPDQLEDALKYQKQWGNKLGAALVAKGFITEERLLKTLGSILKLPIVDISKILISPDVIALVPEILAEKHDVVPVALESNRGRQTLLVAMVDPLNLEAIDDIKFTTGHNIKPVLSTISNIYEALMNYYGKDKGWKTSGITSQDKMTVIHQGGEERTIDLNQQVEELIHTQSKEAPNDAMPVSSTKAEVRALLRLLIKKGILSKDDYLRELEELLQQK